MTYTVSPPFDSPRPQPDFSGLDVDRIAGITLDLDDTLWPVWPAIEAAERAVQQWLHEHCPRVVRRYTVKDLRRIRTELIKRYPERSYDLGFLRRQTLLRALGDCGYQPELAEQAYELFLKIRNRVQLFDDVLPVLRRLQRYKRLAAVTNGNADLQAIGLSRYLPITVRATDTGCAKPAAALFHSAAEQLRLVPEQILHIGDHPVEDVKGACDVGMQALWLNRNARTWPLPGRPPAMACDLLQVLARLDMNN